MDEQRLVLDHHRPLGKRPFVADRRDLRLKSYLDAPKLIESTAAPASHSWRAIPTPSGGLPARDRDPLFNDVAGCCVYSAPGHMVKMIGQQVGDPIVVTSEMVRDAYSEDVGYDPQTGANDNGQYIREMLKRWKARGLYGTKLLAYAAIDPLNPLEVALASLLGCGTIGGYLLPLCSQGQSDDKGRQLWYVPPGGWPPGRGPGTWGGHCIWACQPSPGLDGGNSWGDDDTYWTPSWREGCCDELWLCIVDRWRMANGRAPNGFAFDELLVDAAARGGASLR